MKRLSATLNTIAAIALLLTFTLHCH